MSEKRPHDPPVTVYFRAFWPLLEFNDRISCIGLISCSADKLAEITAWIDSKDTMPAGFHGRFALVACSRCVNGVGMGAGV